MTEEPTMANTTPKIITINEVEYDYSDLPYEAKGLYEQMTLLEVELSRIEPKKISLENRKANALARLTELLKPEEEKED